MISGKEFRHLLEQESGILAVGSGCILDESYAALYATQRFHGLEQSPFDAEAKAGGFAESGLRQN